MPKNTKSYRQWHDKCTCITGRDYDGSEFGPCSFCERETDKLQPRATALRDAARWRISHVIYPQSMDRSLGYFCIEDESDGVFKVGIQPDPVGQSLSINSCIYGRGGTEGVAIDRMFLKLDEAVRNGALLPAEIEEPRRLAALARERCELEAA